MSGGQLGASVTDDRRVERERRRVFQVVGKFLFEHSLDPIPANYMLVHMLVTGSNASAIAAIEEATGDGLRLTQDDADRIMTMLGEASPTPVAPSAEAAIEEARRQVASSEARRVGQEGVGTCRSRRSR